MWEIIQAGGFAMIPLVICSILALAIILERAWMLRVGKVAPTALVNQIWNLMEDQKLNAESLARLQQRYLLGRVLTVGLSNTKHGRALMRERMDEEIAQVLHLLERFLSTLGTIAAISPLLGLLGTVMGMIDVFTVITEQGAGNPALLADGIAAALLTTAVGLTIALPALIAHRYFNRKIEEIELAMERQAIVLVNIVAGISAQQQANEY